MTTIDESEVLSLAITDKAHLLQVYMPFLKNGGIFVQTKKSYNLGDDAYILIKLLDESEKHTVSGKIVWISPLGAQGALPPGIGVQLSEEAHEVKKKIETFLAGAKTERRTSTM